MEAVFTDNSDICQQLLDRYGKSSALQHRHLCATAAATRAIIESESLPLTPLSYFAAIISTLSSSKTLDSNALGALSSLLSIGLPLVPAKAIAPANAGEALEILVGLLEQPANEATLGTSSSRALVKCIGFLVGFCESDNWESMKLGFETLLKFSIDKRPKVRKCAHDSVLTVLKSFDSSDVTRKASKSIYALLKHYKPLAFKMTASASDDQFKNVSMSKPENQEVLHLLHVLKSAVPCLSIKVQAKVLSQLLGLVNSQHSVLTRHAFDVIGAIIETSKVEAIVPNGKKIIDSLMMYISSSKKNPTDSVLFAATLAKSAVDKLCAIEASEWFSHVPVIISGIAGLLTCEASAFGISITLKELIKHYIDSKNLQTFGNGSVDDNTHRGAETSIVKSICAAFCHVLITSRGIPNEHTLAVISVLFLKLGELSNLYMKDILLKLAGLMTLDNKGASGAEYLQECIGCAIIAMGPGKLLELLPIELNAEDFSCSNTWLIPVLEKYVIGSSLGFFMEHIVPLAESFQLVSCKVKKSVIGQDLQAYAHSCWGLLPAFCRYPTDIHQKFGILSKLLIPFLKKDSFMLDKIAGSLQELVNRNKGVLDSDLCPDEFSNFLKIWGGEDIAVELKNRFGYSKRNACRNIKALSLSSEELLHALVKLLFETSPECNQQLKDAIECLASISDPSVIKRIFISSIRGLQLSDELADSMKLEFPTNGSVSDEERYEASFGKDSERRLILELASCIIEGASEDLVNMMFGIVRHVLEVDESENIQLWAYITLNKMIQKHSWFCSLQFVGIIDLLLSLKSPGDISSLTSRFACFQTLFIHAVNRNSDEEDTKAFLLLNEIILTLKDSKEEGRRAAYNAIADICLSLRNSSSSASLVPHHKLINMIMGYFSGSSPHMRSGAVSALSVLVYNDKDMCLLMPDLVPSVLVLLQNKGVEVIKAVLGFVKVLVSCLQAKDLQNFLSDILKGILPWSSNSRHHFRSKVTVIIEILLRKCGGAAIKSLVPEKYKSFLKNVSQNRRGKTGSKEADNPENEPKLSDVIKRTGRGKKHVETAGMNMEDSMGSRKRKRGNKLNGMTASSDEPQKSAGREKVRRLAKHGRETDDGGSEGGHPSVKRIRKRRNFKNTLSGRNGEMGRPRAKKSGAYLERKAGASKMKNVGRRWQKTNK